MPAVSLTLLTLNCLFRPHARARLTALAPLLETSIADVACLQEVVLQGNAGLVRRLSPSYQAAAWMPNLGVGIRGGLVTMSRYPIETRRFEVYRRRGRLRTIAFADWLLRKGFLITWLRVDGQSLVVINTHLLANYDEDWQLPNDYAHQLQDELRQLEVAVAGVDKTVPLVLAGDLNVPSSTQLIEDFAGRAGLTDGFAEEHPPTIRPGPFAHAAHAIDYVFVRAPEGGSCSITSRIVFDKDVVLENGRRAPLSDHFGIQAAIRFDT
jgi:endonuclease/exonuclease/phosphatase family metal-dependent hydrolase